MDIKEEVEYWENEYLGVFKKHVPSLPMMVSKFNEWYVHMVSQAVKKKEELTQEEIVRILDKMEIKADLISGEEEENGNKD